MNEGYEAEVRHQTLLVHKVPFVSSDRIVKYGTLACPYVVDAVGNVSPPENHQVWWSDETPCYANGQQLKAILFSENPHELIPGLNVRWQFSNKPTDLANFSDHYSKMVHYICHLSDQARAIDQTADARTGRVIEQMETGSVFRYADTASARAEIVAVSQRLATQKIAIIGLGGTGSYVLDQVAKTPVLEIHLFDADIFEQHNAFRAPGAASAEDLRERLCKVEFFKRRYEPMRCSIFTHDYFITEANVSELDVFDFVFVCVDKGSARRTITSYLKKQGVAFVDVGMAIELVSGSSTLAGMCRATLVTADSNSHIEETIPMMDGEQDALYGSNIQIADMNMLNAALAVIQWKQFSGFYQDDFGTHHLAYTVNSQSLARSVQIKAELE
ncbi:MAG: ThiF family adenylyltransferase [Zoogloeaceae bacterium]|nr:ThiF family adenylyltransferase [Zoogloeaceae bacterium]